RRPCASVSQLPRASRKLLSQQRDSSTSTLRGFTARRYASTGPAAAGARRLVVGETAIEPRLVQGKLFRRVVVVESVPGAVVQLDQLQQMLERAHLCRRRHARDPGHHETGQALVVEVVVAAVGAVGPLGERGVLG